MQPVRADQLALSEHFVQLTWYLKNVKRLTWSQLGMKNNHLLDSWEAALSERGFAVANTATVAKVCKTLDYFGPLLGLHPEEAKKLRRYFKEQGLPLPSSDGLALPENWKDEVPNELRRDGHAPRPETPIREGVELAGQSRAPAQRGEHLPSGVPTADGVGPGGQTGLATRHAVIRAFKQHRRLSIGLSVLAIVALLVFLFVPRQVRTQPEDGQTDLTSRLLAGPRWWIAINPSRFTADERKSPTLAPREIDQDLDVLRGVADGLITFGSDGDLGMRLPPQATAKGFLVLMGVFIDPLREDNAQEQLANAQKQKAASGYLVFYHNRNSIPYERMHKDVSRLKSTGKPVAVRQDYNDLLGENGRLLRDLGDFVAADVPSEWREGGEPADVIGSLQRKIDLLARDIDKGRHCLLMLVSYPSGGKAGLTPENQRIFFQQVLRGDLRVPRYMHLSFYDAFDPPRVDPNWQSEAEAHRGLFTNDRLPKLAVQEFISRRQ